MGPITAILVGIAIGKILASLDVGSHLAFSDNRRIRPAERRSLGFRAKPFFHGGGRPPRPQGCLSG